MIIKRPVTLTFPKKENFNVPEGTHRAVTKSVFVLDEPYKDQTEKSIRIKWRVPDLEDPINEYVIAKKYPYSLEPHSLLREDLTSWLGEEGLAKLVIRGQVQLSSLEGIEADIQTSCLSGHGYKNPFVYPTRIQPAGTLTRN